MAQAEQVTTTKKLNPPQKQDIANWVSDAVHKLQDQSGMVIKSFATCGITGGSQLSTADHEQSQQCLTLMMKLIQTIPLQTNLKVLIINCNFSIIVQL